MDWFAFPPTAGAASPPWPASRWSAPLEEGSWGGDAPVEADVWALEIFYAVIAGGSTCSACGAPLGRTLRVCTVPAALGPMGWDVTVETRCRGWRRHRFVAVVVRQRGDVLLDWFTRPGHGPLSGAGASGARPPHPDRSARRRATHHGGRR
jgi:hypothetical protein